jgi:hypothetical protein
MKKALGVLAVVLFVGYCLAAVGAWAIGGGW